MSIRTRLAERYHSDGMSGVVYNAAAFIYNTTIRPHLPKKVTTYNTVSVRAGRKLDSKIPWIKERKKAYESGLVDALQAVVEEGDDVVIVGGGWGVTAVVAATAVGDSGSVTVYEGSATCVDQIRDTAKLNDVEDRITVEHAIIGPAIQIRGDIGNPKRITSNELPDCDILELDCEGAEVDILSEIQIRPRNILVETHEYLDAPKEEIVDLLDELSYEIQSETIANKEEKRICVNRGVYVLTTRKKATDENINI